MSADGVRLVREIDDAFARRDAAAVFARLHPDIDLHRTDRLPCGGHFRGHEGTRSFCGRLTDTIEPVVSVGRLIEAEDPVVVVGRTRGHVRERDRVRRGHRPRVDHAPREAVPPRGLHRHAGHARGAVPPLIGPREPAGRAPVRGSIEGR